MNKTSSLIVSCIFTLSVMTFLFPKVQAIDSINEPIIPKSAVPEGILNEPYCVYYHTTSGVEFGWRKAPEGVTTDAGCESLGVPAHSHLGKYHPRSVIIDPFLHTHTHGEEHSHHHDSSTPTSGHNVQAEKQLSNDNTLFQAPFYTIQSSHKGEYNGGNGGE